MSKVSWQQWGTIEYMGVDGAKKKKIGLITYTGSIAKLLSEFFQQLKEISMHQFHKLWQLRNFNNTLQHLQIGQVLFIHDFQMNLMLFVQDEPVGVHWEHPQITVHPTSVFNWCLNECCNKIVHEDIIHISDDKKHDKHAVSTFINKSIEHLTSKSVPIMEIIDFMDQCSGQSKSKFTFHNITKFNIPYTRHFYGVKHGKGPSDRAGGRFKKFMRNAVKAKHTFQNVNDVYEYCKEAYFIQEKCNETNKIHNESDRLKTKNGHIQKIVFNHPVIVRNRDEKLNGIAGSHDYMHAVHNTGVRGVVQYRFFDCCCYGCTTHNEECSQQDYANDWTTFCLTGKLKDRNLQLDSWFKAIGERIKPNNVEEFEQFAESDEEDHTTHEDFVCETTPEIPADCDVAGPLLAKEVFIHNENDEPLVELSDSEFDNDFVDNHTSDVHIDGNEDNDSCIFVAEEEYVSSDYSEESEVEYEAECVQQIDIDVDNSLNFN